MQTPILMKRTLLLLAPLCFLCGHSPGAEAQRPQTLKTEHFDRDPGWEGHNNRIVPKKVLMVKQDFGYSATHFAGKAAGRNGRRIQRSTTPASYAAQLAPARTLDDKLTASGSFAITASQGGAGVFFGFFNSQQPGGSGRPIGSLGLDFDFEGKGGRLAVRLITGGNKSCGTFITPYLPGKFRPTPIKNDGTRYHWTLDYDPQGAERQRAVHLHDAAATLTRRKTTARSPNVPSRRRKLAFPTRPLSPWTSRRATRRKARPSTASACST